MDSENKVLRSRVEDLCMGQVKASEALEALRKRVVELVDQNARGQRDREVLESELQRLRKERDEEKEAAEREALKLSAAASPWDTTQQEMAHLHGALGQALGEGRRKETLAAERQAELLAVTTRMAE